MTTTMTPTADAVAEENVDLETTRSTTVLRAALHKAQLALEATGNGDVAVQLVEARVAINRLTRELRDATAVATAAERKVANLWQALAHEADRRDWCAEYDEFAQSHGGPSRYTDIAWKAVVQYDVQAPLPDQVAVPQGLQDLGDYELVRSFATITVRIPVSGSTPNQRRGRCGCNSHLAINHANQRIVTAGLRNLTDSRLVEITCEHCTPSAFE